MAKKNSLRSAPSIVSGRDTERCMGLILRELLIGAPAVRPFKRSALTGKAKPKS
jgi:hypothetical protein